MNAYIVHHFIDHFITYWLLQKGSLKKSRKKRTFLRWMPFFGSRRHHCLSSNVRVPHEQQIHGSHRKMSPEPEGWKRWDDMGVVIRPPKKLTAGGAQNDGPWKRWLLLNMVIFDFWGVTLLILDPKEFGKKGQCGKKDGTTVPEVRDSLVPITSHIDKRFKSHKCASISYPWGVWSPKLLKENVTILLHTIQIGSWISLYISILKTI